MATRLIPLPHTIPTTNTATGSNTRPNSTDPNGKQPESSYSVRALPIKLYLPDNAPVIQEVVPPMGPDGESLIQSSNRTRSDIKHTCHALTV